MKPSGLGLQLWQNFWVTADLVWTNWDEYLFCIQTVFPILLARFQIMNDFLKWNFLRTLQTCLSGRVGRYCIRKCNEIQNQNIGWKLVSKINWCGKCSEVKYEHRSSKLKWTITTCRHRSSRYFLSFVCTWMTVCKTQDLLKWFSDYSCQISWGSSLALLLLALLKGCNLWPPNKTTLWIDPRQKTGSPINCLNWAKADSMLKGKIKHILPTL